jgi:hypothetical protein
MPHYEIALNRSLACGQSRDELPVSAGHLNMFVGLDGDSSELNLPKYNTWWFMRDAPINKLVDDYYSHPGPVPEVPFMFVGFPSAKVLPHDATRGSLDTSSAAHGAGRHRGSVSGISTRFVLIKTASTTVDAG